MGAAPRHTTSNARELSRSTRARHHDHLITGDVQIQISQVVDPGPPDADLLVGGSTIRRLRDAFAHNLPCRLDRDLSKQTSLPEPRGSGKNL